MKKITVKKQLVDFMIANGNDFRYTDMIKAILRICRGKNYAYTRADRGFYATNLSNGNNGYLVNGGGECGVYKNEHGKWSAKYYTREDKVNYIVERQINILSNLVSTERYRYESNMRDISKYERGTRYYTELLNSYMSRYRTSVESHKSDAKTKILKGILKIA